MVRLPVTQWCVVRRLAAWVAAVKACIGLAGCSSQSATRPSDPILAGVTITQGLTGPVIGGYIPASSPHAATITGAREEISGTVGRVRLSFTGPGSGYTKVECNILEIMVGTMPPSEVLHLPLQAAIYLLGCVAGQMP
jgi:hypothetical protein